MKTIMTNGATNGMFLLNTGTSMESQHSIIESITETIIEPIIFKC